MSDKPDLTRCFSCFPKIDVDFDIINSVRIAYRFHSHTSKWFEIVLKDYSYSYPESYTLTLKSRYLTAAGMDKIERARRVIKEKCNYCSIVCVHPNKRQFLGQDYYYTIFDTNFTEFRGNWKRGTAYNTILHLESKTNLLAGIDVIKDIVKEESKYEITYGLHSYLYRDRLIRESK